MNPSLTEVLQNKVWWPLLARVDLLGQLGVMLGAVAQSLGAEVLVELEGRDMSAPVVAGLVVDNIEEPLIPVPTDSVTSTLIRGVSSSIVIIIIVVPISVNILILIVNVNAIIVIIINIIIIMLMLELSHRGS